MPRFLLILAVGVCCFAATWAQTMTNSYVTVVGADTVTSKIQYQMAVTLYGNKPSAAYNVGIQSSDGTEVYAKSIIARQWTTTIVRVPLGTLSSSKSYRIFANGTSVGDTFSMSKPVLLSTKEYSTFIQTDKATYKPGDLIQFRFVVLDRYLKPVTTKPLIQVYINDKSDNRLKQWNNVTLKTGVFSNSYQLSDFPPLGTWKIVVEDGANTNVKTFVVDEYVLPKFSVSLSGKRNIATTDSTVSVTITGTYAFGQDVKGTYNITASRLYYIGASPVWGSSTTVTRSNRELNGKSVETYNLIKDFGIYYDTDIYVSMSFAEKLTGSIATASYTISVRQVNYKVTFNPDSTYTPGLPYIAYATVTDYDGAPIRDTVNPAVFNLYDPGTYTCFRWRCTHIKGTYSETQTVYLDRNGVAKCNFTMPTGNNNYLQLTVQYNQAYTQYAYLTTTQNPVYKYIQATPITTNPTLSSPVWIQVDSTEPLKYLSWQISAGNNIQQAKTIKINPPSNQYTFSFIPTNAMGPTCYLVVYYFDSSYGYIVSDNIQINFATELPNKISITVDPTQVKPAENVTINVSTSAKSFVAIMGVDQKVQLLRAGNDLNAKTISDSVLSYNNNDNWALYDSNRLAFYNARTVVLTNAPTDSDIPTTTTSTEATTTETYDYYWGWGPPIYEPSLEEPMPMEPAPMPEYDVPMAPEPMQPEPMEPEPMPEAAEPEPQPAPEAEDGASGAPTAPAAPIVIRKDLPETWFMLDIPNIGSTGNQSITKKCPQEITTWMITGFAVNTRNGFGMTNQATQLRVFLPFFIQLSLPYSIINGETIAIPLTVFNYQNFDVVATVIMDNSLNEYDFITTDGSTPSSFTKTINIPANDGTQLSFLIRPNLIGYITIKITAFTDNAGDGISQQLRVEPEGIEQTICNSVLVDLRNATTFKADFSVIYPPNLVQNSSRVQISCVGEMLGKVMNNLGNLIQMPYGCGEQVLLTLVPNIVVLFYLTSVNKLTATIKANALNFIEQGYQKELSYRWPDGSYSAWGPSGGGSGSTWLTAYAAKSFRQAQQFSPSISENVIKTALDFLVSKQRPDGSFREDGFVIHSDMKGGGSSAIGLDAFVTTAFLQTPEDIANYNSTITKSFNNIVPQVNTTNGNLYALAVAAYALQLAKHPNRGDIYQLLMSRKTVDGDLVYWKDPNPPPPSPYWWYTPSSTIDVEMTSYCLMAMIMNGNVQDAMPVVKWLLKQQNPWGGFFSTQDTVVGITALAQYALAIQGSSVLNQKIVAKYGPLQTTFTLTKSNAQLLQQKDISPSTKAINVTATGTGTSIFQACYFFNIIENANAPRFTIDVDVSTGAGNTLVLDICSAYIIDASRNDTKSNMAIMEISLTSGYEADTDQLRSLVGKNKVSKYETKNSDTSVAIYFNELTETPSCIRVIAELKCKVADLADSPITLTDYYDSRKAARVFYNGVPVNICEICNPEDCPSNCPPKPEPEPVEPVPEEPVPEEPVPEEPVPMEPEPEEPVPWEPEPEEPVPWEPEPQEPEPEPQPPSEPEE